MTKISAIITSGGSSTRFGSNKLLEKLGELSVIETTILKFIDLVDEIITISDEEAIEGMKMLNVNNISSGISAGAAYMASKKIKEENKGKKILFILPDDSKKYESLGYLRG